MNNKYIFSEYTVQSWRDCRELLEYIKDWVFRGQSNFDWTLQTTLDRAADFNNSIIRERPVIERKIIEKFQRRATHYLDNTPDKMDILEWLSLIQHHGGPTRLLDFSYSYYVSLFFSVDQSIQDSAIYCLNKDLVYTKGLERERVRGLKNEESFGTRDYCNEVLNEQTLSPLVMLIEPYNMHERLSRQQGLFAIPFEGHQTFEYNLSLTVNGDYKELPKTYKIDNYKSLLDKINNECALLKIKIPKEYHKEIRKELRLMNITNETLFPGIDGFNKTLYNEFE